MAGRESPHGRAPDGPPGARAADAAVLVREARPQDMRSVALLRWEWQGPEGTDHDRDAFVEEFRHWADEHTSTHRCLVLARGGDVLGMGWLATVPRVPTVRDRRRRTADVQSVYVAPAARGRGLGTLLIDALVELGGVLGAERITVHSSHGALSTYHRAGFETSPLLLQREPQGVPPAT